MERRKLFSASPRRKLFSIVPKVYRCQDCGYIMESNVETTKQVCPKCGGQRFLVEEGEEKKFSEVKKERISLFSSAEELGSDNEYEEKLRAFSGSTLSPEEFQKEFSASEDTAEEMIEKGFANITSEGIKVPEESYLQSKLFSKISITITKEFDLDPEIMGGIKKKEDVISGLEDNMCPKGIILIKKAHNIPLCPDHENWMHDSGISHDLPLEFGGECRPVVEFKRVISNRYPDAPENIIDLLKSHGIIDIDGENVKIKTDKND